MHAQRTFTILAIAGGLIAAPANGSTWVGGHGDYSVATRWDPIGTPCFEILPVVHEVSIDRPGVTVTQDVVACSVDSLTLGPYVTFDLPAGTSYSAGAASIAGHLSGLGGNLTATGATFAGNDARVTAQAGSMIELDATFLDATSEPGHNEPLLSAVGVGSSLSLASLVSIDAAYGSSNPTRWHRIRAVEGGSLDLSSLVTVILPENLLGSVIFGVADSGALNIDRLAVASGDGTAVFTVADGGSLDLPALSVLRAGAFVARSGGQITANSTSWTIDSSRLTDTKSLAYADGTGSSLDLSGLTFIDAGFSNVQGHVQDHRIVATSGASINLAGLTSVIVPDRPEDRLTIRVSDSAALNLDNLRTASGGGQVYFDVTAGGILSLPALDEVKVGRFFATEGGQIFANQSQWTLDSTELNNNNFVLISAVDAGSLLDLSGLTFLDASFDGLNAAAHTHSVVASDGGRVDLSGLVTLRPPRDSEDRFSFEVGGAAALNLDSLASVSGWGPTLFNAIDGATLRLPSLSAVSTIRFFVSTGGQIIARDSAWSLASMALEDNHELCVATGVGSVLDLSGMTRLFAGFNRLDGVVQAHTVTATDGAVIDLSGIQQIEAPAHAEDELRMSVGTDATLRLGPLSAIGRPGQVNISLDSPGARLVFPRSLNAAAQISLVSVADSSVEVTGSISFAHTDESAFDLESARISIVDAQPLMVEVGGADEGTTPITTPNFGFAQLIVGSPAQATHARLVDHVDNGNGFSLCSVDSEALYLYGDDTSAQDGLRILNGSTLDLGNINLYASVGGVLMHINPMLTPGVKYPWDQGFIVGGRAADADLDGIVDAADNCVLTSNPAQEDSDDDGYGNACDADLDGDLNVNNVDLGQLKLAFFSAPGSPNWNPAADLNADGFVNAIDLGIMKDLFSAPPGPSCVAGR